MSEKFISNRLTFIVLASACAVILVSMGLRQTFGLFFQAFEESLGVTRTEFGLAIGIQMIFWGIFAPIFGLLADKFGGNKAVFIGFIIFSKSFKDPVKGEKISSILALVGFINIPIIKFSVDFWNTLHQPASISRLDNSTIHVDMMIPLFLMFLAPVPAENSGPPKTHNVFGFNFFAYSQI